MSSDRLHPPDLILILECDSIHLVGSVRFKQISKTFYTCSRTSYIWEYQTDNIFFSDSARYFFVSVLCRLILDQRICTEHSRIRCNGFGRCHCNMGCIYTACRPDALTIDCIWHRGIAHRFFRKRNFQMRQNRTVDLRLFFRFYDYKFLRHIMTGS